ncbi:unnamed protein product [Chrysoparadoxa australica]
MRPVSNSPIAHRKSNVVDLEAPSLTAPSSPSRSPLVRAMRPPSSGGRSPTKFRWSARMRASWVVGCLVALAFLEYVLIGLFWGEESLPWQEPGEGEEQFTVVINTFKRPDRLPGAVQHYASCRGVDAVRVVWSEQTTPPLPGHLLKGIDDMPHAEVMIDPHKGTSLNNRFVPLQGVRTAALFHIDDDIRVPCTDLANGFKAWQQNRRTLVGYYPRVHSANGDRWDYEFWWFVFMRQQFSMILTKAAFLHHDYMEAYSGDGEIVTHMRDYVDANRNCEDVAMSLLVADTTKAPQVYVRASLKDSGVVGGISFGNDWQSGVHAASRSDCLTELIGLFPSMPLVIGNGDNMVPPATR